MSVSCDHTITILQGVIAVTFWYWYQEATNENYTIQDDQNKLLHLYLSEGKNTSGLYAWGIVVYTGFY